MTRSEDDGRSVPYCTSTVGSRWQGRVKFIEARSNGTVERLDILEGRGGRTVDREGSFRD
jgi:hypothetical protein